jgi:hypothetical protein
MNDQDQRLIALAHQAIDSRESVSTRRIAERLDGRTRQLARPRTEPCSSN